MIDKSKHAPLLGNIKGRSTTKKKSFRYSYKLVEELKTAAKYIKFAKEII